MRVEPFVVIDGRRHAGAAAMAAAGVTFDMQSAPDADGLCVTGVLTASARRTVSLERAGFTVRDALLDAPGEWCVFIDSGTLGWNGVRRLVDLREGCPAGGGVAGRCHHSSLQTVLWNASARSGVLVGFLGQLAGLNGVDIQPAADDDRKVGSVDAWQEFALRPIGGAAVPSPLELTPAGRIALDPLHIQTGDDPLALLECFGCRVREHLGRTFETAPITGYMTWYSKASGIDEATVIGNLPILAELLTGYPQGQRPVLIVDHGWQMNASLGAIGMDPGRFPHGMPWLIARIREHGLEPGLWLSLTHITPDAPNFAQLHPMLATDAGGQPLQGVLEIWGAGPDDPPARTVHIPDADRQDVRDWWFGQLRALADIGIRYFKLDFLGLRTAEINRGQAPAGALHDSAWQTFRRAVTADTHLAPCSCDTNLALGRCDSVRISSDIGEAGNWPGGREHYRRAHSSIAASWFKHRRFWVNDPDSVQIAKGCAMGEARVRATTAAFSGGHLMLSEDLRGTAPERLELFRRLLPAVPTAAVPLDLFDNPFPDAYPGIWRLRVDGAGGPAQAFALFNLDGRTKTFRLRREWFGYDPDADLIALEWWQSRWLGRFAADQPIEIDVPPEDVAILHAQPVSEQPALISCAHHPVGLYIVGPTRFDAATGELSGSLLTRPGLKTVLMGQMPADWTLAAGMRARGACNATGGWQCECVTTQPETPFVIQFCRR